MAAPYDGGAVIQQPGFGQPSAPAYPPLETAYPPPQAVQPHPFQAPGQCFSAYNKDLLIITLFLGPSQSVTNVIPGLECLINVDHLLVKQEITMLDRVYHIFNGSGQQIFSAKRKFLGPFDLKIKNMQGVEVIHMYRPFSFALQGIEVSAPPGNFIGCVEQEFACFSLSYSVLDQAKNLVFTLEADACEAACGTVDFQLACANGQVVGKISKQWRGFLTEAFTIADTFGINFPKDLDEKMKAVLLGATFNIDLNHFDGRR